MQKNLKIVCFATPFIIYAVSLLLSYFIYPDPSIWYENDVEEGIAFRFTDLFLNFAVASACLLSSWLNLFKKIRESEILSFLSFFWPYCLLFIYAIIAIGNPLAALFIIAMWGGFIYVAVLVVYYIIFRIIVKNREEVD